MEKSITRDMTSGSPAKLILKFSVPMLIGNLFQQFYYLIDSIIVGKVIGSEALAAVGATGSLVFLILGLTFGLSAGISIVISQYFGAQDYENVRKGFATATYVVIIVSTIMGIIGFVSSRWLLELLNTPDTIIIQADQFMKITFAGILGVSCYNGMAAILRALGDSVTPLKFLALACLINIGLDFLFLLVFHWGVAGVAFATVLAQIISAICCVAYALAKVKILRMPLKEFKPDKEILKKCLKLGLPVALQNSLVSISMMALQGVINSYNDTVIAAYTVVNRIEQLVLLPGMSLGAALAAYAGQNIGAGRADRARQGYKSAARIIIIFSLCMLPVMYFGGEYIIRLFTKKEDFEVVVIGMHAVRITCFFYSAVGMIFVSRNFLSGTGDIAIPMVMGITEVICRVVLANVLTIFFGYYGIWWATGINWVITAIVGIAREASGKWQQKSLIQRA